MDDPFNFDVDFILASGSTTVNPTFLGDSGSVVTDRTLDPTAALSFVFMRDNESNEEYRINSLTITFGPTQCEVDLTQALSDLAACQAQQVFTDLDGDGEEDLTDACPSTPMFEPVDQGGCSQAQFCALVDTSMPTGRRACRASDWGNDEPLAWGNSGDCLVDRLTSTCVPQ